MKDESSGGCHGRLEDAEAVPRLTSPRLQSDLVHQEYYIFFVTLQFY